MSGLRIAKDVARLEITLERDLAAELAAVWRAWTTVDGLEAWWGPGGWVARVRTLDVRPGGLWHFGMGPAGEPPRVWVRAVYAEVRGPHLLAYREGFSDEAGTDVDDEHQDVTVELFGVELGRTLLVMRTRFPSARRLEQIVSMGFVGGWTEGFDRLARSVEQDVQADMEQDDMEHPTEEKR